MKLLYFSVLGLLSVEAGRRNKKFRCSDRYGRFRGGGLPEWDYYNSAVLAARESWYERAHLSVNEICARALDHEACQTCYGRAEEEAEEIIETTFQIDTPCGRIADEWANAILSCQMCNSLAELEKEEDDGSTDLETKLDKDVMQQLQKTLTNATTSQYTFAKVVQISSPIHAQQNTYRVNAQDGGTVDASVATTGREVEKQESLENGGRSVGKPTSMHVIKTWFKKVSSGVWNVVVSGGPEYCKDMLPKYPRIKWGKMKQGHPNWFMVKEIRDNCVILHGVIKETKCFCVYLLWGCHDWHKVKRCAMGWQRAKGSIQERKYCFYFSNLKGGIWKPKRHPTNPLCKGVIQQASASVSGNGHSVGIATNAAPVKYEPDCLKECKRRAGKGKGSHKRLWDCANQRCVKEKPTTPPPPPKQTMEQCKQAGFAWCVKWMKKKGKRVVDRCKKSLTSRSKPSLHAFCVKLGLDMEPL